MLLIVKGRDEDPAGWGVPKGIDLLKRPAVILSVKRIPDGSGAVRVRKMQLVSEA